MTNEDAIKNLKKLKSFHNGSYGTAIDKAIKALEQQLRDCKTCKYSDNGNCAGSEECHECMWESKYEQQPCEDAVSRKSLEQISQEYMDSLKKLHEIEALMYVIPLVKRLLELPSVTPKYTDEEIDRAQAVEQAYVDKMVELAVEETKERYSDAVEKAKKAIDEMTEIHSDGEFYIKNVDVKWIINRYAYGDGGGEDDLKT